MTRSSAHAHLLVFTEISACVCRNNFFCKMRNPDSHNHREDTASSTKGLTMHIKLDDEAKPMFGVAMDQSGQCRSIYAMAVHIFHNLLALTLLSMPTSNEVP